MAKIQAFAQAVRRQKEVSCAKSESTTRECVKGGSKYKLILGCSSIHGNFACRASSTNQHVRNADAPDAVVAPQQLEFERMGKSIAVATAVSPLAGVCRNLPICIKKVFFLTMSTAKAKAIENLS